MTFNKDIEMSEFAAMEYSCFWMGFIGGLCGMSIALTGLKAFFVRHYMRFYRTKDYLKLHNCTVGILRDIDKLKKQMAKGIKTDDI